MRSRGYSEAAADVLRQPGGIAWDVFDARIADVARQFEDFRNAERAGAVLMADTVAELAQAMHVPAADFAAEWNAVESLKAQRRARSLRSPVRAGAALRAAVACGQSDRRAVSYPRRACDRRLRPRQAQGRHPTFPNLFAAGGAAAGVSGDSAAGYLSGNGLLTATVLGRLAGMTAAAPAAT